MPEQLVSSAEDAALFNLPISRAQPERLATIARLRNVQTQEIEHARVLELSCSAGHNLLPWAERYPGSTFVGMDISRRAIDAANDAASALGLGNVEIREQSFLGSIEDLGKFDYIVAHGLYSTLDDDARERLFDVCRDHLAPRGLAYISYNTYPGWHVHDLLRRSMLYQARGAQSAGEQIHRARSVLEFLKTSLTDREDPYQAIVAAEVEPLTVQPDELLRRAYLQPINRPVYFQDFVAHAKRHALKFFGDGAVGVRFTDSINSHTEENLAGITNDPIRQEQYRDILRNRVFRQTVLCHESVDVQRAPSTQMLQGMFLAADLRADEANVDLSSSRLDRFMALDGSSITTAVPLIKAALVALGAAWPNYLRYEDLIVAACDRLKASAGPTEIAAAEIERLEENLLQCCYGGVLDIHVEPQSFSTAVAEMPIASGCARWQAQRGNVVTNRKHEAVRLDDFDTQVVQLLDGTRDRAKLSEALIELSGQGRLGVVEAGESVRDSQRIKEIFCEALPDCLKRLARNALLVN